MSTSVCGGHGAKTPKKAKHTQGECMFTRRDILDTQYEMGQTRKNMVECRAKLSEIRQELMGETDRGTLELLCEMLAMQNQLLETQSMLLESQSQILHIQSDVVLNAALDSAVGVLLEVDEDDFHDDKKNTITKAKATNQTKANSIIFVGL